MSYFIVLGDIPCVFLLCGSLVGQSRGHMCGRIDAFIWDGNCHGNQCDAPFYIPGPPPLLVHIPRCGFPPHTLGIIRQNLHLDIPNWCRILPFYVPSFTRRVRSQLCFSFPNPITLRTQYCTPRVFHSLQKFSSHFIFLHLRFDLPL